ncbi:glycosyltransferase [Nocardioides sp. TRM66260-LWL]|uniref:glycosyltransferase n=1 Tax=Nocardioides sp. TRM66260-LWL TaxID=2874478 RepID=UPI001CC3B4B6|nr:glycosyltransferase [Nocardioides sp. TRM66260-LWL]MBZ5735515.1 glycosyltransferase [Nocardioides sp. TRM66260-LWL]
MTRALVVTVVHHPQDARIRQRQIPALLEHGWEVTYAAPFTGYDVAAVPEPGLRTLDVPRARGRRRLRALRAARALLRREAPAHDVVLLHDPELLLATTGLRLPPVVWDVHEDTAAALGMKAWLPASLSGPAARGVRAVERRAERRVDLLLAEDAYQQRFARPHPVVPNTTRVPDRVVAPGEPRVVYVGHLTRARGALEMIAAGALLHERTDGRVRVQLVGPADAEAQAALVDAPGVEWLGFRPYAEAMALLDGALAGLSLLHDQPNYRVSRPSKVAEYLAHGLPVVTTPLPEAVRLVEEADAGRVVPFVEGRARPEDVVEAVLALEADPALAEVGARGHVYAQRHLDWRVHADAFVRHLAGVAAGPARG